MEALFTYFWKIKVFICKSEVYKLISSIKIKLPNEVSSIKIKLPNRGGSIKIKLPNGEVVSKLSYLIE